MPQSLLSKINVIDPTGSDIIVTGAGNNFVIWSNSKSSTFALRSCEKLLFDNSNTAKLFSKNELTASSKEVEMLWRQRTKKTLSTKPIPFETFKNAQDVIAAFSVHYNEPPEVASFPDGDVCFDWETKNGALSILIDTKEIYWDFKSQTGKRRNGNDTWNGTLPREVLQYLNVLFSSDESTSED